MERIVPIKQRKGYRFRVDFQSGDAVMLDVSELHAFRAFEHAVLEQLGEPYEPHGSVRTAREREHAWMREMEDALWRGLACSVGSQQRGQIESRRG